jgi:hypothetical protein
MQCVNGIALTVLELMRQMCHIGCQNMMCGLTTSAMFHVKLSTKEVDEHMINVQNKDSYVLRGEAPQQHQVQRVAPPTGLAVHARDVLSTP